MEHKKTFGSFILQCRKELGMTQKDFAARLFVTESAVSKWERGVSLSYRYHIKTHVDFCSTDTAGGLDNKKRRYAPRGGVEYRLFLWGFPKGACPHLAHDFACKV